jgi:hypothetical protein
MGVTSSQYIICSTKYHGKRTFLQAGNREWVTVVETINAEGGILPPYLTFKGKALLERWSPLPLNWASNPSQNGWTSDQICLDWLQKHFIHNSTRKGVKARSTLEKLKSAKKTAVNKDTEEVASRCFHHLKM